MGHLQAPAEAVDATADDALRARWQEPLDMIFEGREENDIEGRRVVRAQHAIGQALAMLAAPAPDGRLVIHDSERDGGDTARLGRRKLGLVAPVHQPGRKVEHQIEDARAGAASADRFGIERPGDQLLDPGAHAGKAARICKQGIENRWPHGVPG